MRIAPALILAACGTADAARPLQTEDAPVMDPRACEVESGHSDFRSGDTQARRTYAQFGCGIGWHSEIALQAAKPRELSLGGKTRLAAVPWRDGELEVSVAWNLSHHRAGARWRRSSTGALLAVTAPLSGDWVVHGNLGHLRDLPEHQRSTTWALALEHNGLGEQKRWQPMVELFGDDRGHRWINAGLRVTVLPDQLYVDGALGRRVAGPRATLGSLGLLLAF